MAIQSAATEISAREQAVWTPKRFGLLSSVPEGAGCFRRGLLGDCRPLHPLLGADILDPGPKPTQNRPKTNQKPAKTAPKPAPNHPKPAKNENLRLRADISAFGTDIPPRLIFLAVLNMILNFCSWPPRSGLPLSKGHRWFWADSGPNPGGVFFF